ncbi:thiolase domain-containing protein [Candidatus Roizmanbacteria bacterium]|nr:thiolase domain-containing protein [Candidatus Roizmanbacteria bacterium]
MYKNITNNTVFILGGAQTDFARNWSKEGKNFVAMMREVVEDGLQNVGLDYADIKDIAKKGSVQLFVANFDGQQYFNQGNLGSFFTMIDKSFISVPATRYEAACASGAAAIDAASAKIRSGDIDVAIVLGLELMKTQSAKLGASFLGSASYYEKEAEGIDFPFPKLFGRLADEILDKYKIRENLFMDCLAEISRINYSNAKRNPFAQTRSWFMNKKHAQNRKDEFNQTIGGLLCISDCSQVTDGAALVFLASKKYAESFARKRKIVINKIPRIKGEGFTVAPALFEDKIVLSRNQPYILPLTKLAIDKAYNTAKINIDSIDFIEAHDCFTSSEYAVLSAFGLTKPGEEYNAIVDGTIDFHGKKPVNPSGGLIGVGHPVGASGVRMILDLYKQTAEKAGNYQISNAKNGIMLNIGGSATTNIAFVVGV